MAYLLFLIMAACFLRIGFIGGTLVYAKAHKMESGIRFPVLNIMAAMAVIAVVLRLKGVL